MKSSHKSHLPPSKKAVRMNCFFLFLNYCIYKNVGRALQKEKHNIIELNVMSIKARINTIIVTDFENKEINLLDKYKGKNLLIIIYRNQCLGFAGRAIPLANDFQNEFKDLQVIGIHTNFGTEKTTKEEVGSVFRSGEFPFPIYLDEQHEVFDQFESQGTPQWLIIAADKVLHRSIFGSQLGEQNRLKYALEDLMNVTSQF